MTIPLPQLPSDMGEDVETLLGSAKDNQSHTLVKVDRLCAVVTIETGEKVQHELNSTSPKQKTDF